jgi:ribosomal-protein-alanine N-acetyltransferase
MNRLTSQNVYPIRRLSEAGRRLLMGSRTDQNELRTERLTLRRWHPDDLGLLARLGSTPAIVRYIGDGSLWSAERAAAVHDRTLAHWEQHGFGWRVAVERASGSAVGLIALNLGDGVIGLKEEDHEIGWWLDPAFWGRGLASEGARAVRDEALGALRAPTVFARIQPGNAASIRVAEGLGLRPVADFVGGFGEPVRLFRL